LSFLTSIIPTPFLAVSVLADSPRERLPLDSNWRFQLGDPAEIASRLWDTSIDLFLVTPLFCAMCNLLCRIKLQDHGSVMM